MGEDASREERKAKNSKLTPLFFLACSSRIGYEFEGYDLVFCCFEKIGWVEEGVDKRKK